MIGACLCISILLSIFLKLSSARNLITLETCHSCKSNKNSLSIDFSNVSFTSFNNTVSFNGSFSVASDITGLINLELETFRCTLQHKQCQKFSKLKFDDICGKFLNSKLLGDRFVSAVTPKLECPFKRGVYQTENVVLDLEFAAKLPFDGWYWNVIIRLTGQNNKKLACYEAGATISGKASKKQFNTREKCLSIPSRYQ